MKRQIAFAGLGALGSRIALSGCIPMDYLPVLIDDDRVGHENIPTSAFGINHVGALKANAVAQMLYLKYDIESIVITKTLRDNRALKDCELVIDTFDNPEARSFTCGLNTLHAGLSASRSGDAIWDSSFPVPPREFERGNNPVCTNHLGTPIIAATATAASLEIMRSLLSLDRRNVHITPALNYIFF